MHDAFEAAPILEKLPLQIESIACYSEFPIIGDADHMKITHLSQGLGDSM